MSLRQEKLKELIKDLAASFLQINSNGTSLITVTDANVSNDFRKSSVFFTVYPEGKEKEALDFTKRMRSEFRDYVKERTKMKLIPFFDFKIDEGEKNRQKIDELLITQ